MSGQSSNAAEPVSVEEFGVGGNPILWEASSSSSYPENDEILKLLSETDYINSFPFTSDLLSGNAESSFVNPPPVSNDLSEFRLGVDASGSQGSSSERDPNPISIDRSTVRTTVAKQRQRRHTAPRVSLSTSVDVTGVSGPEIFTDRLQIVYPLEEYYRQRYKSDCFAQNGTVRSPRYVCDRNGNHFITLTIPLGFVGYVRIDWVTVVDAQNNHYSMPYKFQENNASRDAPDSNPIFKEVTASCPRRMLLKLVLIKSKQDELRGLSSLSLFGSDTIVDCPTAAPLSPKQLIEKYKLKTSQLAFTLYHADSEKDAYTPDWTSTVYSTVLTEETKDVAKRNSVICPACKRPVPLPASTGTGGDEGAVNTGKQRASSTKRQRKERS